MSTSARRPFPPTAIVADDDEDEDEEDENFGD